MPPLLAKVHLKDWTITAGGRGVIGTFVSGGSEAAFDNFWTAHLAYTLPANAVNVSMTFGMPFVDDRAALILDEAIIGANSIGGPTVLGLTRSVNFTADDCAGFSR